MYSPQLLMWVERWAWEWREEKRARGREGGFRHGQRWSGTLRDTRSKREKDQSDQLSDQGQSYELHIPSSYLTQISSFEWLHGEWYVWFPALITCLALCTVYRSWCPCKMSYFMLYFVKTCLQISGTKAEWCVFIVYMLITLTQIQ